MEAAVVGLNFGDNYFKEVQAHYTHMKNLFVGGLKNLGFTFTEPQGAYFVQMDVSEFGVKDDVQFCEWLASEVGVGAVPGSSFFKEDVNHLIRFHFAKQDETLNMAFDNLSTLRAKAARRCAGYSQTIGLFDCIFFRHCRIGAVSACVWFGGEI